MIRPIIMLCAAASLGCDVLTDPEDGDQLVISQLNFDAQGVPLIEVPDQVAVGEEFVISIGTAWADHCVRKGDTEVELDTRTVLITPHELQLANAYCIQVPATFTHEAAVRFDQAGIATVNVRGRDQRGSVVTYERAVTVQ